MNDRGAHYRMLGEKLKSFSMLNNALQEACGDGRWIYWTPVFVADSGSDEVACVANSHAHVELGLLSDGLEALLARMPEAEAALDAL